MRVCWLIFTMIVVVIWAKVYFDESIYAKTCYVMENSDGTQSMMSYIDESVVNKDNVTNVSSRFEYLSVSYLAQGVLSLIAVLY